MGNMMMYVLCIVTLSDINKNKIIFGFQFSLDAEKRSFESTVKIERYIFIFSHLNLTVFNCWYL